MKIWPLLLRVNLHNDDSPIAHMLLENVPLHFEVLRAVGDALIYGKEESIIVIFEDLAIDCRREGVRKFDVGGDFLEHGAVARE